MIIPPLGDIDQVLADWIFQAAPELLFHYTDQTGLLGIVRSSELWATHVQYLNDRREWQHAVDLANRLISERLTTETDPVRKRHLSYLVQGILRIKEVWTCVASWSATEDDLSQWRAYSRGRTGYCIAFAASTLRDLANNQEVNAGFLFAKCVYDPVDQENLMGRLIDATVADTIEWGDRDGKDSMITQGGHMFNRLIRYGALFKDKAFKGEQEWRLISPVLTYLSDIREGQSTLIPYCRFSLDAKRLLGEAFGIEGGMKHIRVGPCPDPELAQNAVSSLLHRQGIHNFEVLLSDVPYRNWL